MDSNFCSHHEGRDILDSNFCSHHDGREHLDSKTDFLCLPFLFVLAPLLSFRRPGRRIPRRAQPKARALAHRTHGDATMRALPHRLVTKARAVVLPDLGSGLICCFAGRWTAAADAERAHRGEVGAVLSDARMAAIFWPRYVKKGVGCGGTSTRTIPTPTITSSSTPPNTTAPKNTATSQHRHQHQPQQKPRLQTAPPPAPAPDSGPAPETAIVACLSAAILQAFSFLFVWQQQGKALPHCGPVLVDTHGVLAAVHGGRFLL